MGTALGNTMAVIGNNMTSNLRTGMYMGSCKNKKCRLILADFDIKTGNKQPTCPVCGTKGATAYVNQLGEV
jgi:hypothetical protein